MDYLRMLIFVVLTAFSWQTKAILSIPTETQPPVWPSQGVRTISTPPPTRPKYIEPREVPVWPMPPPGPDYDRLLEERLKTVGETDLGTEAVRRSRTPNRPTPPGPNPAVIWPRPPPGEDYDRLMEAQVNEMKKEVLEEARKKGKNIGSRRRIIPFVPFNDLPVWERQDPILPARRFGSIKQKSLRKKSNEPTPSTTTAQANNVGFLGEDAEATKWPKVRSHYDRRRDYVRSTRLAPYQLLQDDPTTTTRRPSKMSTDPIMEGDFNQYSMKDDLETMLREIDEANVTVEVITRTVEYNDIVICKITQSKQQSRYFRAEEDKYMDEEPEKKIVFIVHGLSAMGFTKIPCLNEKKSFMKLLKYYTAHLDKFDIFLIPMANPDGVGDETLENWNKNKSPQSACLGVALDRNFDVSWNASSSNSCNQQYPGPSPFSELESRAIGDVLHYYSHKIIAYIHVHGGTYDPSVFKGDAVLYPKGFTEVATEDDKYIDIKGEIDEAIRNAGFKVMSVSMETLYNWYGKVHGSSVDFASTIYGVPYALEFVMQPYEDNIRAENSDEKVSDNVLTEIWKRVIDIVFTNIYKNTHGNDVK